METYEQRRARPPAPGSKKIMFIANKKLVDAIESLGASRNRSAAIRMLLWLGIEQYKLNYLSRDTTGKKRKEAVAERKARLEAEAARRKALEQGRIVPLLVPLDFEDDD